MTVSTGSATATGHVRHSNEDSHRVGDGLWVVADGIGGHPGGAEASRLAVAALLSADAGGQAPTPACLSAAVQRAHAAVVAGGHWLGAPDMGTTLVAGQQVAGGALVAWVGDSRAYLLDGRRLRRLTDDHNEAEELLAAGRISQSAARRHPGRHLLTRALGCGRRTAPQVDTRVVHSTGRLLLCTDGLHGELPDRRIAALLADGTPEAAANRLVQAALDAGGRDNVTVVVVDLEPTAAPAA